MEIRPARGADLESLVSIYNHYVLNRDATFDETLHSVEDRTPWFESFGGGPYRLLVATDNAEVIGYAGSSRYRAHASFDETVELTVYIAPDHTGQRFGSGLYEQLIEELAAERVHRDLSRPRPGFGVVSSPQRWNSDAKVWGGARLVAWAGSAVPPRSRPQRRSGDRCAGGR